MVIPDKSLFSRLTAAMKTAAESVIGHPPGHDEMNEFVSACATLISGAVGGVNQISENDLLELYVEIARGISGAQIRFAYRKGMIPKKAE